jgi:uncharacterized repeat protein (TIGR01451 family)
VVTSIEASVVPPILAISKTGPVMATAGHLITYTLTVTNSGGLATELVLTDAIPVGASHVSGGVRVGDVVSWTVPSLGGGESLTCTFSVTATETITNSDYRVSADGGHSATGSVAAVTTISDDQQKVYLPIILKQQ